MRWSCLVLVVVFIGCPNPAQKHQCDCYYDAAVLEKAEPPTAESTFEEGVRAEAVSMSLSANPNCHDRDDCAYIASTKIRLQTGTSPQRYVVTSIDCIYQDQQPFNYLSRYSNKTPSPVYTEKTSVDFTLKHIIPKPKMGVEVKVDCYAVYRRSITKKTDVSAPVPPGSY